jgi:hypothetical protein
MHIVQSRSVIFLVVMSLITSCKYIPDAITGATKTMEANGNSLFHQTDEVSLKVGELIITGEVEVSGKVNLDNHYKREVVIKESVYDSLSGVNFLGAFRYRGYSLFDLLHPYKLNKKNAELFRPAIDAYIVITNQAGDQVVFSWSEIFHTNNPHQIIIATEAAPIVPYRKEVDYKTGSYWKVMAANDLFSFRVIENPTTITVYSFDKKEYPIERNMDPMFSQSIEVFRKNEHLMTINPDYDDENYTTYYSSFYGMGMGYHEAENFSGPRLADKLSGIINPFDQSKIQKGLVCFAGLDGYRAIYSYSELFNRVDQVSPLLAVPKDSRQGGFYRFFAPSEFYADRSVKSVKEIYFFQP